MSYYVNDPRGYHLNNLKTLGWEITVSQYLEQYDGPIHAILTKKGTFGELLFDFLGNYIPLFSINRIMEIGGGYGYLMRDFAARNSNFHITMVDISDHLLDKQQKLIKSDSIHFVKSDFFELSEAYINKIDLLVLNEILGDFPVICNLTSDDLDTDSSLVIYRLKELLKRYSIKLNEDEINNVSIGALETIERICINNVKYAFISEHSCEARVPQEYSKFITVSSGGNPQRIPLFGHDEYSIKFSFLDKIARYYGYRTVRGSYNDFITVNFDERIEYYFRSKSSKDEHEIIRHFIEDIFQYEYLILINDKSDNQ